MNALSAIAFVAERKIEEAIAQGEFDNLPGMGRPLELEDLSHLPPDMRMAYTILKNSGYLENAPEKNKPLSVRDMLSSATAERTCYAKMQRLKVMMARVERAKEEAGAQNPEHDGQTASPDDSPYFEKLLSRV